ncbi:MAG: hypothetical protein ACREEK_27855 [Bradyrhizobium sp.]
MKLVRFGKSGAEKPGLVDDDALPRNATGKVFKNELRASLANSAKTTA